VGVMNAKELRKEFESNLKYMQEICQHPESEWMASEWAPGHISGSVEVCTFCEKVLDRNRGV